MKTRSRGEAYKPRRSPPAGMWLLGAPHKISYAISKHNLMIHHVQKPLETVEDNYCPWKYQLNWARMWRLLLYSLGAFSHQMWYWAAQILPQKQLNWQVKACKNLYALSSKILHVFTLPGLLGLSKSSQASKIRYRLWHPSPCSLQAGKALLLHTGPRMRYLPWNTQKTSDKWELKQWGTCCCKSCLIKEERHHKWHFLKQGTVQRKAPYPLQRKWPG